MLKLILGLVGRKGAGKGTVAKFLETHYGAKVFRFSAALADVLRRLHIDETNENMVRLSEILRKEFGEAVLKNAVMEEAKNAKEHVIVLDGLRRVQELEGIKTLGRFIIISVEAPLETRYKRIHERREKSNDATITFEEFKRLQAEAPTEVTIANVEARAEKTIVNAGTIADLERAVQTVMQEIQR